MSLSLSSSRRIKTSAINAQIGLFYDSGAVSRGFLNQVFLLFSLSFFSFFFFIFIEEDCESREQDLPRLSGCRSRFFLSAGFFREGKSAVRSALPPPPPPLPPFSFLVAFLFKIYRGVRRANLIRKVSERNYHLSTSRHSRAIFYDHFLPLPLAQRIRKGGKERLFRILESHRRPLERKFGILLLLLLLLLSSTKKDL